VARRRRPRRAAAAGTGGLPRPRHTAGLFSTCSLPITPWLRRSLDTSFGRFVLPDGRRVLQFAGVWLFGALTRMEGVGSCCCRYFGAPPRPRAASSACSMADLPSRRLPSQASGCGSRRGVPRERYEKLVSSERPLVGTVVAPVAGRLAEIDAVTRAQVN